MPCASPSQGPGAKAVGAPKKGKGKPDKAKKQILFDISGRVLPGMEHMVLFAPVGQACPLGYLLLIYKEKQWFAASMCSCMVLCSDVRAVSCSKAICNSGQEAGLLAPFTTESVKG
jgi:hypothetical protein